MKIEGRPYTQNEFQELLKRTQWKTWKPKFIVIHHCAEPSLAQRPHGFIDQHMRNLQDHYEGKGWSAGPHFFVDDDQVWTFSPMTARGVHAVAFNSNSLGLEMLGDYDREDPLTGRGEKVLTTTACAVVLLLQRLGLTTAAIRFHRDDPGTSKTCPGKKISKAFFTALVLRCAQAMGVTLI